MWVGRYYCALGACLGWRRSLHPTVPKSGDGPVECLRMLLVARRWATKARTQAANQIHSVIVEAPEQVKHQLKGLNLRARVAVCARWRPGQAQTTAAYAKKVLRYLARRYQTLNAEITQLEGDIRRLCARANPALLAANGVGPDTASVLVVAAGDNPGRMRTEASFAALCGASPVQASSGQTRRHRLNRGGNRHANSALWPMRYHPDAYRRCHQRICDQTPRGKQRTEKRSSAASSGTSPHRSTDYSPTRHQPRTAPAYATSANKAVSPSPRPLKPSEPTPPASQNSNEASTTTTSSLPDTRPGSEPTNPPRHRFDNRRSILGMGVRPRWKRRIAKTPNPGRGLDV